MIVVKGTSEGPQRHVIVEDLLTGASEQIDLKAADFNGELELTLDEDEDIASRHQYRA